MAPLERPWEYLAVVAAVLTAIGSIPAWFRLTLDPSLAEFTGISRESVRGGITGDGVLTLVLALVVIAFILRAHRNGTDPGLKTGALTFLCGAVTTIVGAVTYRDATRTRSQLGSLEGTGVPQDVTIAFSVDITPALWVVLAGGILLTVAGIWGAIDAVGRRRADFPERPA